MKKLFTIALAFVCICLYSNSISAHCTAMFTYTVSGDSVFFTADTSIGSHAKISWNFGDGHNSHDRKPTHVYHKDSTYTVCMEMTDSPCSEHHCEIITIGHPKTCINGVVMAGKNAAYPGYAILYKFNPTDSSWSAADSTKLDSSGHYEFGKLAPGTYIVKAGLDSTSSAFKRFVPCYFERASKWHDANKIIVTTGCKDHQNIYLHENGTHSGTKHVKGHVHNGHKKQGNDAGIEVMLLNSSDAIVDYAYTDALGAFDFAGLPNGTYKVYTEFTGLPTTASSVTVSDANGGVTGIDIEIGQYSVVTGLNEGEISLDISSIQLFPNPVSSVMNVQFSSKMAATDFVTINDMSGRLISTTNIHTNSGNNRINLNTNNLQRGMYILTLSSLERTQRIKFVKE
jgi:PKD repeat protein